MVRTSRNYFLLPVRLVTAAAACLMGLTPSVSGQLPAVTGVKAESLRPREVLLSWEMSPDKNVVGYEISRTEEGSAISLPAGTVSGRRTTTFVDRGKTVNSAGPEALGDGKSYTYEVRAFDKDRVRSPPSAAVTVITRPAIAAPTGLTATLQLPRAIRVQWQPIPETNIASYVLESADSAVGPFRKAAKVSADGQNLTATDKDIPDGVKRCYRVKAVSRDKRDGAWSQVVEGASKPRPNAPTELKGETDGKNLVLTWMPPPQGDIRKYCVWKKNGEKWSVAATADMPKCAIPRAKQGQAVTLAVTAIDSDGLESQRCPDVVF